MAAASGFFWDESFVAATSASLASAQFSIVTLSTGTTLNGRGPIVLCTSSTQGVTGAMGVLQDNPAAGVAGSVRLAGITKCLATTSAAVTQGAFITCTTGGMGMVADTSGQLVIGKALSGSTGLVSGSLFDLLISGPYPLGLV